MKVEIRPNTEYPETYDLFVNGKLRVKAESWQVVHNIKDSLLFPAAGKDILFDECDEVAAAIRAKVTE